MIFAYADPPYLGCARKLYGAHHPNAQEWDKLESHVELIKKLTRTFPDGWALSCLSRDLRHYLPICPEDVRVASWSKPFGSGYKPGQRIVRSWEPVIYRTLRTREPGIRVRDSLSANATRQLGLPGAKPAAFNRWVLDLLGWEHGDELVDLFPGTCSMQMVVDQGVLL